MGHPTRTLTAQQQAVLNILTRYYEANGEACSARFVARRLRRHHSTIHEHLVVLAARGLIVSTSGLVPTTASTRPAM